MSTMPKVLRLLILFPASYPLVSFEVAQKLWTRFYAACCLWANVNS